MCILLHSCPSIFIFWYPKYRIINLVSLTIWQQSLDMYFQLSVSLSTESSEPRTLPPSLVLLTLHCPGLTHSVPCLQLHTAAQQAYPPLITVTRANSPTFPLSHWTHNIPSFILYWEFSGVRIPFLVWITRTQWSTNTEHLLHWIAKISSRINP